MQKTKKNCRKYRNAEELFFELIEIDEVTNVQKLCKFHQNITETGY